MGLMGDHRRLKEDKFPSDGKSLGSISLSLPPVLLLGVCSWASVHAAAQRQLGSRPHPVLIWNEATSCPLSLSTEEAFCGA